MNIALWVIAGLLAAVFLLAGITKLTQPKEKLATMMTWTKDHSEGRVKTLGTLEVLAAIGLILPAALNIVPVLVPLAALGLVVVMIGAVFTHARRNEYQAIGANVVILLLAAVVVWGRFGPYSF
jgi:uncharacterized membrane protein YphA (DoxX/SURF4 family)